MSNIPITQGTGASSVATDTISGIDYQKIKLFDGTAASTNAWKINTDGSAQVSVFGTPTVTFSGAPSISGAVTIVGTPSISGAVTIVGTPSISGAVTVVGTPSISGTVIATQIAGSIMAVSASAAANQSVSGTVHIDNLSSVIAYQLAGSVLATSATAAANQSVSGTVGASIIGTVPVSIMGGTIGISGATIPPGSVSGTVGASIIGTVPMTMGPGTFVTSVVGDVSLNSGSVFAMQSGAWTTSVVGGPVTLYAPSASLVSAVTSVITTTTSVTVLAGAPGGQRNYITNILATNAGAVGTVVNIYDGGNVVYAGYAAASGGGFSATLPAPLRQASAQGALCAATVSTSSVIVAVSGYTAT